MKIYTKQGDKGETGLFDGSRVAKNHPLIDFYGALDELNASIGLALCHQPSKPLQEWTSLQEQLSEVQRHLFEIGADSLGSSQYFKKEAINGLELWIDQMQERLPPLKNFILPSGIPLACHLHLCRCKCRGVERLYYSVEQSHELKGLLQAYLNRLSDYLFVAARYSNFLEKTEETPMIFRK